MAPLVEEDKYPSSNTENVNGVLLSVWIDGTLTWNTTVITKY